MPDYINRDWLIDVSLGTVTGAKGVRIVGFSKEIGINWMTFWPDGNTIHSQAALRASPSTVKLASVDNNDTYSGGTGAQVVHIIGLDSDGDDLVEDVNLNGQTEVTTTGVFSAINGLRVWQVGSNNFNHGRIWCGNGTFTLGIPNTKYCIVTEGYNISHCYIYTVPTGKVLLPLAGNLSSNDIDKGFVLRASFHPLTTPEFYPMVRAMAQGNNFAADVRVASFPIQAQTIFSAEISAHKGAGGQGVLCGDFVQVDAL